MLKNEARIIQEQKNRNDEQTQKTNSKKKSESLSESSTAANLLNDEDKVKGDEENDEEENSTITEGVSEKDMKILERKIQKKKLLSLTVGTSKNDYETKLRKAKTLLDEGYTLEVIMKAWDSGLALDAIMQVKERLLKEIPLLTIINDCSSAGKNKAKFIVKKKALAANLGKKTSGGISSRRLSINRKKKKFSSKSKSKSSSSSSKSGMKNSPKYDDNEEAEE